jgi:hypothetical protein
MIRQHILLLLFLSVSLHRLFEKSIGTQLTISVHVSTVACILLFDFVDRAGPAVGLHANGTPDDASDVYSSA